MKVTLQVYDGTFKNRPINFDRTKKIIEVPTESNPHGEEIPLLDILLIEKADESNVKEINPNWNLDDAYANRPVSNWGAAFGILGIVGEVMYKGAKIVFILKLKNGMEILALTEERYLKEIKELKNDK